MRPRGVGQALPDISQLPAVGDLQGQLSAGQNLFTTAQDAIVNGNPNAIASLLSQGVTVATGQSSSSVGVLARDVVQVAGAAIAGGAVGGPFGAAAGIVAAVAQVIFSAFTGPPSDQVTYLPGQPSQSAQRLYQLVKQWQMMSTHFGPLTGYPIGWTYYDYISRKYPPKTTSRSTDLFNQVNAFQKAAASTSGTNFPIYGSASGYMKSGNVQPLCTPIFWLWGEPNNIQFCTHNKYFGSSNLSNNDRYSIWGEDTVPIVGSGGQLSKQQIMSYAEQHRPDPMFYCADLYVAEEALGIGHGWPAASEYSNVSQQTYSYNQVFGNLETLSGVATACGILAAGGGVQSVAEELLLDQLIIQQEQKTVPPLFRMLVDSYVAQAQAERAALAANAAPSSPVSTGTAAAAVAAGAAAAVVVGVLGYSLVTKTRPKDTVRLATARAGRLFVR